MAIQDYHLDGTMRKRAEELNVDTAKKDAKTAKPTVKPTAKKPTVPAPKSTKKSIANSLKNRVASSVEAPTMNLSGTEKKKEVVTPNKEEVTVPVEMKTEISVSAEPVMSKEPAVAVEESAEVKVDVKEEPAEVKTKVKEEPVAKVVTELEIDKADAFDKKPPVEQNQKATPVSNLEIKSAELKDPEAPIVHKAEPIEQKKNDTAEKPDHFSRLSLSSLIESTGVDAATMASWFRRVCVYDRRAHKNVYSYEKCKALKVYYIFDMRDYLKVICGTGTGVCQVRVEITNDPTLKELNLSFDPKSDVILDDKGFLVVHVSDLSTEGVVLG